MTIRISTPLYRLPGIYMAISPNAQIVADIYGKLPCEREIALGAHADVVARAVQHRLLQAWFGNDSQTSPVMVDVIRGQLTKAICNTLALLNKVRAVTMGHDAVMQQIESGQIALVVMAGDASPRDGRTMRRFCHEAGCDIATFADREVLGSPFGRKAQVYVGIKHTPLLDQCRYFLQCSTGFAAPNGL